MSADRLNLLLHAGGISRLMGAHDGLTAKIAQQAGFDGLWASGLGISASYGLPDAGILTATEFLQAAVVMRRVSDLPVLADCDAGFGDADMVARVARDYANAGIDGICLEDKQYPKRNSFWSGNVLAEPQEFAGKVRAAREAAGRGLMVVARLESFIVGESLEQALDRAHLYVEAGAQALVVHSRQCTAAEIAEFCRAWQVRGYVPVLVIPTTYHDVTLAELEGIGVSAVIYANHLLRAGMAAMQRAAGAVFSDGRTTKVEGSIASLEEVFDLCSSTISGDAPAFVLPRAAS